MRVVDAIRAVRETVRELDLDEPDITVTFRDPDGRIKDKLVAEFHPFNYEGEPNNMADTFYVMGVVVVFKGVKHEN